VDGSDTGRVEAVLYAAATVAGSLAVLFLAFVVRAPVSPVTKFVALAAVGGWFVVAGQLAGTRAGAVASYVLAVVSLASGSVQLIGLLSLGGAGFAALFAAVAALFAGLARWVRAGRLQPLAGRDRANAAVAGGGAVAVAAVVALDALTGGVAFALATVDAAEPAGEADEPVVRVGTVEATNTGVLPYGAEQPAYRACLAGNWSEVPPERRRVARVVTLDGAPPEEALGGGERARRHLGVVAPRYGEDRRAELAGVPVVETDACPGSDGGPRRIAVYRTEAGGIRPV
jgi:hypothetical protein